jgi:hypothetical protein
MGANFASFFCQKPFQTILKQREILRLLFHFRFNKNYSRSLKRDKVVRDKYSVSELASKLTKFSSILMCFRSILHLRMWIFY